MQNKELKIIKILDESVAAQLTLQPYRWRVKKQKRVLSPKCPTPFLPVFSTGSQ